MQRIKERLLGLFEELWPPLLFFFVAFLLIATIFKLLVEQYAVVHVSAFASAGVFAFDRRQGDRAGGLAESGYDPDRCVANY